MLDLPLTAHGKNVIAVVVDELSRQAHFLALSPNLDAIDLAQLYLHEVSASWVATHSDLRSRCPFHVFVLDFIDEAFGSASQPE
jgi:hypothetical protein